MKKEPAGISRLFLICMGLVVLLPLLDLGLGQSLDVLGGVDGSLAANTVDEVQALGSLEQGFLVTSRIAELTGSELLDHGSGLGVILLLADDLLHGMNLLSFQTFCTKTIIHNFVRESIPKQEIVEHFAKDWLFNQ